MHTDFGSVSVHLQVILMRNEYMAIRNCLYWGFLLFPIATILWHEENKDDKIQIASSSNYELIGIMFMSELKQGNPNKFLKETDKTAV